jgi:hypothetical protein
MNKELAAQFLSAIITRNSGQRIEDDVKEALAYAEAFERLTATYTTPPAVLELVQNPPLKQDKWTLRFNGTDGEFNTKQYRNDTLVCLLDSYDKAKTITFLVAANNGILSTWTDKGRIVSFYSDAKHVHVIPCFSEAEVKKQIDAYYEERGGFAKHVEYLKSIGQW